MSWNADRDRNGTKIYPDTGRLWNSKRILSCVMNGHKYLFSPQLTLVRFQVMSAGALGMTACILSRWFLAEGTETQRTNIKGMEINNSLWCGCYLYTLSHLKMLHAQKRTVQTVQRVVALTPWMVLTKHSLCVHSSAYLWNFKISANYITLTINQHLF